MKLSGVEEFQFITQSLGELHFEQTFSHGDFGVKNLLYTTYFNPTLYIIDPIPGVFGCTELDAAKLVASLMNNVYSPSVIKNTKAALCAYNNISELHMNILIASVIMRIYKYAPDKEWIKKLILKMKKEICS